MASTSLHILSSSTPALSFPLRQKTIRVVRRINHGFSRQDLVLHSSNCRLTRIDCRPTDTSSSSIAKDNNFDDDQELNGQHKEDVNVVVSSLIDYLPTQIQPYAKLARLEKPTGTWLFIWPFAWSASMAAATGSVPDLKTLALYLCAAPLLRGATCTINDILDRDVDRLVERTKTRPIASGQVTSLQGLCFYAFQLLLSHGILLQIPNYSVIYEASLIFLVSTYPLMKRFTNLPGAYLGVTMSWGSLFGWYAIKGSIQPSIVLPFIVAVFCWTLLHDTIYAHQDKEDDIRAGVKSLALNFGDSTKQWITGFAIACIASLALAGYNAEIGWPYYASLVAASGHLAWQIETVDLSSPADCNKKFASNVWLGAIVFGGIVLGRLFL